LILDHNEDEKKFENHKDIGISPILIKIGEFGRFENPIEIPRINEVKIKIFIKVGRINNWRGNWIQERDAPVKIDIGIRRKIEIE